MHFFRHTFYSFLYVIMETLLEGVPLGCAQAHPVAPPMLMLKTTELQNFKVDMKHREFITVFVSFLSY
jgi:hypothetical protein